MFNLVDACIEHLGALPSQLNLSNAQATELLAYNSIKSKASHICDGCVNDDQVKDKTCFLCGRTYTDKHGVVRGESEGGGLSPLMAHAANQGKKSLSKASDEEKENFAEAMMAKLRADGKLVDDGKLTVPDGD